MANERIIFALAAALVLFSFLAPNNFSAFAVAGSCISKPVLHISPNPVQVGQLVTASVTGLKNCFGAEILLKDESVEGICSGKTIASYQCRGVNCEGSTTFSVNTAKDYLITACIDLDDDGYFLSANERSPAVLKAIALPDLSVSGVVYSQKTLYSLTPFAATATVLNNGAAAIRGFTTKYEIFRVGEQRAVYTYSTGNEASSGIAYFRQNEITAWQSTQVKFPAVTLAVGNYKVKVTLDAENRYAEADENNNVYETTITVL